MQDGLQGTSSLHHTLRQTKRKQLLIFLRSPGSHLNVANVANGANVAKPLPQIVFFSPLGDFQSSVYFRWLVQRLKELQEVNKFTSVSHASAVLHLAPLIC